MVRSRMDILYLNKNMESVRQIALRNFKEIYQDFIKNLKVLLDRSFLVIFNGKVIDIESIEELIEKYEELAK